MCLLGCDIGSSSIKVSIVDEETGLTIGADFLSQKKRPRSRRCARGGRSKIRRIGGRT